MSPEKAFGEVVREVRNQRGMSQEKLAFSSGLDRSFVSQIERGVQSPTITSIFLLGNALSMPVSQMMLLVEQRIENQKDY